jgi:hypothetical protein
MIHSGEGISFYISGNLEESSMNLTEWQRPGNAIFAGFVESCA